MGEQGVEAAAIRTGTAMYVKSEAPTAKFGAKFKVATLDVTTCIGFREHYRYDIF